MLEPSLFSKTVLKIWKSTASTTTHDMAMEGDEAVWKSKNIYEAVWYQSGHQPRFPPCWAGKTLLSMSERSSASISYKSFRAAQYIQRKKANKYLCYLQAFQPEKEICQSQTNRARKEGVPNHCWDRCWMQIDFYWSSTSYCSLFCCRHNLPR